MIWEELGFTYLGPVDGHDIGTLRETLKLAQGVTGRPVLVHVITTKGKGYKLAEEDAVNYHGVAPNGTKKAAAPSYTKVFARTLCEIARADKRVVAITAAMTSGTGLTEFVQEFPDRCFDVGIAEEHAVTFAAGLASQGMRPVAAIYSTFVQRAYDQVVHDVCIQNLPVILAMDRAGIVGDDGRTHQGVFDFSYLRHIPNITIMAPKDENELQAMLYTAFMVNGPVALRYPRGAGVGVPLDANPQPVPVGKAEVLRRGKDVAIVAIGSTVYPALAAADALAAEGIDAAVINARFVKPLDRSLIAGVAKNFNRIVTVEENMVAGGFGSAVLELLEERALNEVVVRCIGLPDEFIEHATPEILRAKYNLDAAGIAKVVRNTFPELRLLPREGWLEAATAPALSGVPANADGGAWLAPAAPPAE
jgi:1-deoxy-D-xylulose-5-phosphate synthase